MEQERARPSSVEAQNLRQDPSLGSKSCEVLRGQRVEGVEEVHANRRGVRGVPPDGDDPVLRQVSDLDFEVGSRPNPSGMAAWYK